MSHDTIVHRAIRPAIRALARIGVVTPDHLTAARFATGLGAAAMFARGRQGWVRAGAGLFLVSAFLDRADGELARQTRRFSRNGHRYDLWADYAADVMCFVGLGFGATAGRLGRAAAALGLLGAAGTSGLFWQADVSRQGRLPGLAARDGRVLADPDDAMFAVPFLLWGLGAEAVLLPAGTLAPAFALWMARRARRRRRHGPATPGGHRPLPAVPPRGTGRGP